VSRAFGPDVLAHYVPAVLAPNGRYERIRELLTSAGYLSAKLAQAGPAALASDFRAAQRLAPSPAAAAELLAVETAVTGAAPAVAADPAQFPGQLLARLPRGLAPDVDALLEEVATGAAAAWLRPHGAVWADGALASFGPVAGSAAALAVSDDASVLLAGDGDGGLHAWDLRSRERLWRQDTGAAVTAVTFRPGSFEAFAALDDGGIVRWSRAGRRLRPFTTLAAGSAASLAAGEDVLVCGCGLWVYGYCLATDTVLWQGSVPAGPVTAVAMLGDGKHAVSGSADGGIAVWEASTGELADRIQFGAGQILCAAAVPGGNAVAVGTRDRLVVVVDLDNGGITTLRGHASAVRSVAGLPDGRVASGSCDGQVLVWDLARGSSRRVGSHRSWCLAVAASQRPGPVISGSSDGTVRAWDPDGSAAGVQYGQGVRALVVDAGVAYAATDRTVRRFAVATGAALPPLAGHHRPVTALAVAPGGVVSSSYDGTVRRWDARTGQATVLRGHTGGVAAVRVTPDGGEIVSAGRDATWRRWDAPTGAAGPVGLGGGRYDGALALSPDGELVAAAAAGHVVEMWERRTGRPLPSLCGHTGWVERLVFTPDGQRLLSGAADRTLRVWRPATGEPLAVLAHPGWILDLAVTADGSRVFAACEDGSIAVTDLASLTLASVIAAHRGGATGLALGQDGRTLFSAGAGQVRAWDVASQALLAVFDADVPLRELAVAGPDTVVVGTASGDVIPLTLVRPASAAGSPGAVRSSGPGLPVAASDRGHPAVRTATGP